MITRSFFCIGQQLQQTMKAIECKDLLQCTKANFKAEPRKRFQIRHSARSHSEDRNSFSHRPSTDSPNFTIKCQSITQRLYKMLKDKDWLKDPEKRQVLPKLNQQKMCQKALEELSTARRKSVPTKKTTELLNLNPITIRFLNPRERDALMTSEVKQRSNNDQTVSRTIDTRDQVHSRTSEIQKGASKNRFMRKHLKNIVDYNFASIDHPLNQQF